MKLKNKIIIGLTAVVLVAAAVGGHFLAVHFAEQAVSSKQASLTSAQGDLLVAQNNLTNDAVVSNNATNYPETKFKQKETVLLPQTSNYVMNSTNVAQWIVKYINQLRQLNGISTEISWDPTSSASSSAEALQNGSSATGFWDISGVSWDAPLSGQVRNESDQEVAYNIVMTTYDNSGLGNYAANTAGNYKGRAYLLYDGPSVGIAASQQSATLVFPQGSGQDYSTMTTVSSNPNTIPLPDISFEYANPATLKGDNEKINQAKEAVKKAETAYNKAKENLKNTKNGLF